MPAQNYLQSYTGKTWRSTGRQTNTGMVAHWTDQGHKAKQNTVYADELNDKHLWGKQWGSDQIIKHKGDKEKNSKPYRRGWHMYLHGKKWYVKKNKL